MMCGSCNGGACVSPPTRELPQYYPCPRCEGINPGLCGLCGGRGTQPLASCPRRAVPSDVWEAVEQWRLAKDEGLWPVSGGAMDQAATFFDFKRKWEGMLDLIEQEKRNNGTPTA